MKKVVGIIGALVFLVIILGLVIGFGGLGSGEGNGTSGNDSTEIMSTEIETKMQEETEGDSQKDTICITVVENDYFYDNNRIEIDELLEILQSKKADFVVEINEDKASLKVYNKLLDALDELDIIYIERE